MFKKNKLESKEASYCSKEEWKSKYEKKFYLNFNNYNSKLRDNSFRETIEILNDNFNKLFFISSGTLLGYIRESNFIDWDDNIDLSFYFDDDSFNNLKKLQLIFLEKNYVARVYSKPNYLKLSLYKNGYKIDFCSIIKIKNYYFSNLYKFPVTFLDHFKIIKFKDVEVKIPVKYKEYLTYLYGDWKSPKKNNYESIKSMTNLKYIISLLLNMLKNYLKKITNYH